MRIFESRFYLFKTKKINLIIIYSIVLLFVTFFVNNGYSASKCIKSVAKVNGSKIDVNPPILSIILSRFDELFHTTGFSSFEKYVSAIRQSSDLDIDYEYLNAFEILESEKLRIGIRLPSLIRDKVVKRGFLNSYQTRTSQGVSIGGRANVDASLSGVSKYNWGKVPKEHRPKFAALYPEEKSDLSAPKTLDSFTGSDLYYLKLNTLRERLTLTPGDSFNRCHFWQGQYVEWFDVESWDQMFIPWKYRGLLASSLILGLREKMLGFGTLLTTRESEYGDMGEVLFGGNLAKMKMLWKRPNMDYVEAQIWGEITLDHVTAFEFKAEPPSGAFLEELKRRGIKVIDGRSPN